MRTILAFFCCIWAITCFSQSNIYFQNKPQWSVMTETYSGNDCSGISDSYNYYIHGDTLLNGFSYVKIYKKGVRWRIDLQCQHIDPVAYSEFSPSFYLRSAAKKMYIYFPNTGREELLYDFNLSVGDTLPQTYTYNQANSGGRILTVQSIDDIVTPYGKRQRFILSGGYLYEGIGSSGGLTEAVFPLFLSGFHELRCFSLQDTSYVPTKGLTCNIVLETGSYLNEKKVSVYPNPFSTNTTFYFTDDLRNGILSIFNVMGARIETIPVSGKTYVLNREKLSGGIYFYELTGQHVFFSGKLLITD